MKQSLDSYWYSSNSLSHLLRPLSWLFRFGAWIRRGCYRLGILQIHRLRVPTIVVGNITVGGTGKTPLVIWLVEHLLRRGLAPGVVSRGYGGKSGEWPQAVFPDSDPKEVGDEPVVVARRTGCPVFVGPERAESAAYLLTETDCDILVSDDGLQHYALGRDIEIAVIDGERRFGNGYCLPAGPLREPVARLASVDIVVCNGEAQPGEEHMGLVPGDLINLVDERLKRAIEDFIGGPVHAVAGIGNPGRFFATLRQRGLEIIEHPFADHHTYVADDLNFKDELPVLMTEKDAVKCTKFARVSYWFLKTEAELGPGFAERLDALLRDDRDG